MSETTFFTVIESPVGPLTLVGRADALAGVYFASGSSVAAPSIDWVEDARRLAPAAAQLAEYFAGTRTRFELPLAPRGTDFQQRVWAELLRIPFGETLSYGALARAIGKPAASRAVGGANHRNPLSIIVPCHRVVGADGSMTGYGGELPRKRWLLELEARVYQKEGLAGGASSKKGVTIAPSTFASPEIAM